MTSNKRKKLYKGGAIASAGASAASAGAANPAAPASGDENKGPLMKWPNIQFFSLIGPYVLIGFFILLTIFNSNIKGVIYVIGLILTLFLSNVITSFMPKHEKSGIAMCKAFGFSSLIDNSIPFGVLVYSYTFIYLLIPMIQNSMVNFSLIISLLLLLTTDIIIQINNGCSSSATIMMAVTSAILIGLTWSIMVNTMDNSLLYHTDYLTNKQVCSMPSKQKFKCNVYKNGELVSSTLT